jgi:hypothetical protein
MTMTNLEQNSNSVKSLAPKIANDFDLDGLRLSQDFGAMVGVKKAITTVPIRKPNKQWFIRVRPGEEWRFQAALLVFKEENETFLVRPELVPDLSNEVTPAELFLTMNRQGVLFVWPVRLPGPDGRVDSWSQSAIEAAEIAEEMWVRVVPNMSLGGYDLFEATGNLTEPAWPDLSFNEIMRIAFKDKIIGESNHPALKRLRGEI